MAADDPLPLFALEVLAERRWTAALAALDLEAAHADCPPEQRDALDRLVTASHSPRGRAGLHALHAARPPPAFDALHRAWVRLVGRYLDGTGIPGVLDGRLAADWLLEGGEETRARSSLARHLGAHPADPAAWAVAVRLGVRCAALHLAFHGGEVLGGAERWVEEADADGAQFPTAWVWVYAWLAGAARGSDLEQALAAKRLGGRPLPLAGDGVAFTWYLLEALAIRSPVLGELGADVVDARRRLRTIHPALLARFLARTAGH